METLGVVGSSHRRLVGWARLGGNPPGGSLAGNESSPHSSINDSTRIRLFSAAEGALGTFGSKGGFAALVGGTALTSSVAKLALGDKQDESRRQPVLPKFFCVKATSFFDRV
jgi:hypothetical protein